MRLQQTTDSIRSITPFACLWGCLDNLLFATKVYVKLVERGKEDAEGGALGHLSEGVNILREALTAVTKLSIRSWDVGVGVIDVTREKATRVNCAPVSSHLLAILTASIKIGHLIGSEHVVHILGKLSLKWGHDGELLADKDLSEEFEGSCKDHGLLLEVLDVSTLCEELWHVVYAMAGLFGEQLACARKNSGTHEDGNIWEITNKFLHECEVLCAIVFSAHVDL